MVQLASVLLVLVLLAAIPTMRGHKRPRYGLPCQRVAPVSQELDAAACLDARAGVCRRQCDPGNLDGAIRLSLLSSTLA